MSKPPRFAPLGCQLLAALLLHAPALGAESAAAPVAVLRSQPVPAPVAAVQPKPVPAPVARAEARFTAASVYRDRLLSEDTVWRGEVLVEGTVTVAPQATLSIEPGSVIRFRRAGARVPLLLVQGRLVAAGSKDSPIVFGSNFAQPVAADWQGVMLLGSEKKNILENCRIEGAQTGIEALFSSVALKNVRVERATTGMRFQDALVSVEGGGASDCELGFSFSESEANLRNLEVEGNRLGIWAKRSSLYLLESHLFGNKSALNCDGCRLKIQGGSVLANGSGVTLSGCEGSVAGATLAKNAEYGLALTASRLRVSSNEITGNGGYGLIVYDGAAVAWDNALYGNVGFDLYNAGSETLRAPGNWWGEGAPRIFDNGGRAGVLTAPVLVRKPTRPD